MSTRLLFRGWYYFRIGWATYFTFVLSAINTLTVTYYLALEKSQFFQTIFPSFVHYIAITALVATPILVCIGYAHYKKSGALRAEADIGFESNPHMYRLLLNSEKTLSIHLKISEMLLKLSKNERLSDTEIKEIAELQKDLSEHMKNNTISRLRKIPKI